MMKKFFAVLTIFLSCVLLSGCGSEQDDELFLMSSRERNFLQSEFDEDYTHYEDNLGVEKKSKKISVSGSVTSGVIELKIIEKDKDENAVQTYEFTISDDFSETIELEKKHSNNWVVISDFDEETEGGFKVEIFG
ncbi:MAG: hypothetical protein NC299_10045 [Lachnospiraceae bacterium]|nr:hypothetical protein [Ruminococcus sp.]MCM1275692.1 hypothetical protein [Lachnospiraceae bacterium]